MAPDYAARLMSVGMFPGRGCRRRARRRCLRDEGQWENCCVVELAGELHRRARWQLGPIQRTRTTLSAHGAIPAKHVYRRRSARYPSVLASLIAACRLGKAWSLHMSYSYLSLRLKSPVRYGARRLPENLTVCRPAAQWQHTLRKRRLVCDSARPNSTTLS